VLTVAEAATTIAVENVVFSLSLYAIVYGLLLVAYLHTIFYMAKKSSQVDEFETKDVSMSKPYHHRERVERLKQSTSNL
jgi:cytochrome bd ubiquinol oxidase subunit I